MMNRIEQRRRFLSQMALFPFCAKAVLASTDTKKKLDISMAMDKTVSLRDAHKGTLEIDLKIMNQYGDQPQEVQKFYTACREALVGNNPEKDVANVCRKFNRQKLGGPMLGDLTDKSVVIWMHLPKPLALSVTVTRQGGDIVKRVNSNTADNYLFIHCDGLSPNTAYTYEVVAASSERLGKGRFVTAPTEASKAPFRIAFGADFHKVGLYRPELMDLIRQRGNRAMFLIGDSAVDDRENDFALIKADYMLRNLSPVWQRLSANVPIYAAWDDHDYFNNDRSGAFSVGDKPIEVEKLRQTWKQQWNNPQRNVDRKGIYFQTKIGPAHFIVLDTRSCRQGDRRGRLNSFLGAEQMAWLKRQIKDSASPFIFISSGTMWSDYITPGKDSWGTWDTEGREAIFQLIDQKTDAQVTLLSGDRHGARGFAIPRPGNRKIYELEVGTLGGVPGPDAFGDNKDDQLFGYPSRTWSLGEFTFETKDGKPQVIFRLINEKGQEKETILLRNEKHSG